MIPQITRNNPDFSYRVTILTALLVVTPLGFASKFYQGPAAWWFNNHFGGFMYEIFWILLIILMWPNLSSLWVAVGVFLVTCFLEFLQLWHPPFLQLIRSTFLGRTLIGTSFTWWDFLYYILGCTIGWVWVSYLKTKTIS